MRDIFVVALHSLGFPASVAVFYAGLAVGLQHSPTVGSILSVVAGAIFIGNLAWIIRSHRRMGNPPAMRWYLGVFLAAFAMFGVGQGLLYAGAPVVGTGGSILRLAAITVILVNTGWLFSSMTRTRIRRNAQE